jgi:hypothetical protein
MGVLEQAIANLKNPADIVEQAHKPTMLKAQQLHQSRQASKNRLLDMLKEYSKIEQGEAEREHEVGLQKDQQGFLSEENLKDREAADARAAAEREVRFKIAEGGWKNNLDMIDKELSNNKDWNEWLLENEIHQKDIQNDQQAHELIMEFYQQQNRETLQEMENESNETVARLRETGATTRQRMADQAAMERVVEQGEQQRETAAEEHGYRLSEERARGAQERATEGVRHENEMTQIAAKAREERETIDARYKAMTTAEQDLIDFKLAKEAGEITLPDGRHFTWQDDREFQIVRNLLEQEALLERAKVQHSGADAAEGGFNPYSELQWALMQTGVEPEFRPYYSIDPQTEAAHWKQELLENPEMVRSVKERAAELIRYNS